MAAAREKRLRRAHRAGWDTNLVLHLEMMKTLPTWPCKPCQAWLQLKASGWTHKLPGELDRDPMKGYSARRSSNGSKARTTFWMKIGCLLTMLRHVQYASLILMVSLTRDFLMLFN
ncbi:hypothetical protein GQ600_11515 [Phytophthora cactorum]|nr:hypothetical protein GQ600_11515 [Phytophthora cactorum]